MEEEFSALSPDERTGRCLELAQRALSRVDDSPSEETRQLNLNLARCWHSLARQFGTIVALRVQAGLDAAPAPAVSYPVPEAAQHETHPDLRFHPLAPAV